MWCFMACDPATHMAVTRCEWAAGSSEAMLAYHDEEWGVPSHDERHLFELLTLEGAQAGLSWSTILNKRDGYRSAFADFDVRKVAAFGPDDVARLLDDPGIVRNRLKVESTIANAAAILALDSFDAYLWNVVGGKPLVGRWAQPRRPSGRDRPLARALARPEEARLPLRRADRLLLVHAGRRARERPHDELLPLRGAHAAGVRCRSVRHMRRASVRLMRERSASASVAPGLDVT